MREKVGLYHIRSNGRALDSRSHCNGKWILDPRNEVHRIAWFHHMVRIQAVHKNQNKQMGCLGLLASWFSGSFLSLSPRLYLFKSTLVKQWSFSLFSHLIAVSSQLLCNTLFLYLLLLLLITSVSLSSIAKKKGTLSERNGLFWKKVLTRPGRNRSFNRENPDILITMTAVDQKISGREKDKGDGTERTWAISLKQRVSGSPNLHLLWRNKSQVLWIFFSCFFGMSLISCESRTIKACKQCSSLFAFNTLQVWSSLQSHHIHYLPSDSEPRCPFQKIWWGFHSLVSHPILDDKD